MTYLIVVPVQAFALGPDRFAVESAFAAHLRELLSRTRDHFDDLVVAGVAMTEDSYRVSSGYMDVVDTSERIRFVPLYTADRSHVSVFASELLPGLRALRRLVASAGIVHASPSHNVLRPFEFLALRMAVRRGIPTISVSDIDLRPSADMLGRSGLWGRSAVLKSRYLYDPIRVWQHRWIARRCSLVMYKEAVQVEDFGRGHDHVRLIRDPAFPADAVIDPDPLATKIERARDGSNPLEVVYFGRIVPYKGVDHMVRAVRTAVERGADIRFSIMGSGSEMETIERLIEEQWSDDDQGAATRPRFVPPVPYGDAFFEEIRRYDLLLAAPLGPDTPRSTWDAFASGVAVHAYDTPFYVELADSMQAVTVSPWSDVDAFADALVEIDRDRAGLTARMESARQAALDNPESRWLDEREAWTRDILDG